MTDPLVVLRCGVSVPAPAFVLLVDLEARDIQVWREGDAVVVEPADRLTDEDRRAIRALKPHLLVLLDHVRRGALDEHLYRDHQP
jgi:hypothetical protein